ncbi:MAG TPA: uroporphyrinogen-III C-methyltransferase, partial [Fibrobacteres bacterium]|nr:uroporphyrinogen-III C-methyltransferase [Fibrobacterota bacterium]
MNDSPRSGVMRFYPLELDLRDKPVLMVGGGSVAARKLPELLACGAKVAIVSPALSPTLRHLLPALQWHERPFQAKDVQGQSLVFACTNDAKVNEAVSAACRAASVPCNRADAASEGDFIVPGVIRRGVVTVSVSTSGQVPALTRELKRKLDAFLGPEWADIAIRMANVRQGQGVRLDASTNNSVDVHPVFLVGAGPGDRSLLTLGAVDALKSAEVVIHDRLVSPAILELLPETCERISAEKRGHFESQRQEHINEQILAHARAGKRVVRLKGGDPFVFGRGFEEALALEAAGIPWWVIPGVSSATAVPALAGIPVTHRGVARSFAVVSGMAGGETNQIFPKADTLVLLMGLYRLEEIVPALVRSGYSLETPAAAIQDGGLPEQRVCRTTLGKLREDTARQGFDSPVLIVIGDVVNLGGGRGE